MTDVGAAPQTLSGWAGWGIAAVTGLGALWAQMRRGRIDETAIVLAKWKEMTDGHAAALVRVEDRLTKAQETIDALRKQVFALQDEVVQLKSDNAGLVRQIAQVSQSTIAVLAAPEKMPPTMQAVVNRLKEE